MKKLLLGLLLLLFKLNVIAGCSPMRFKDRIPQVNEENIPVNTEIKFVIDNNSTSPYYDSLYINKGYITIVDKYKDIIVDSININDFYKRGRKISYDDTLKFFMNKNLDSCTTYVIKFTIGSFWFPYGYKDHMNYARTSLLDSVSAGIVKDCTNWGYDWTLNAIKEWEADKDGYVIWEFTTTSFNTSFDPSDVTCNDYCDGEVIINTPPDVHYNINGIEDIHYNKLCPDTYNINMTSDWGCQVNRYFVINEPSKINTNKITYIDSITDINNISTEISIITTGGTGNYQYNWSYNDSNIVNNNNYLITKVNGWYYITISDDNYCEIKDSILVDNKQIINNIHNIKPIDIKFNDNIIILPNDMNYSTHDISGKLLQKGFGKEIYQEQNFFLLKIDNYVIKILNNR